MGLFTKPTSSSTRSYLSICTRKGSGIQFNAEYPFMGSGRENKYMVELTVKSMYSAF